MKLEFSYRENSLSLDVERAGEEVSVTLPDGKRHNIRVERNADSTITVAEDDRVLRIPFRRVREGVEFCYRGRCFEFSPGSSARGRGAQGSSSGILTAPMVGTVTEVLVATG